MLITIAKILACIVILTLFIILYKYSRDLRWFVKLRQNSKTRLLNSVNVSRVSIGRLLGKIERRFSQMNPHEREESKLYKYYYTMRTALIASGLDDYVGVESLFIFILIISAVIACISTIGLWWWVFIPVFIVTIISLHTVVLFISRTDVFDRVILLMKAEDMLCTSMDVGIVKAIEDNLQDIDPKVRAPFDNFLINHIALRVGIRESISALNAEVGPLYDSFCERAYQHYVENDTELINGFRGIIEGNSRKRDRLLNRKNIYDMCMLYYGVMLLGTAVFILLMAGLTSDLYTYITSSYGRLASITSIITAAIGFIRSQIIYSRGIDI